MWSPGRRTRRSGNTATIIDRILAQRSIGDLSDHDRIQIAVFVAIQMRRVPNQREHLIAINAGIRKALGDRDIDPELVEGLADITPEEAKAMSLMMLAEPNELPVHILDKTWLLFDTDAATPFYISDNPVAMQNLVEPKGPFRGNLGLAVPGIEIYLPISSTMMLGFFCRSHEAAIRNGVDRSARGLYETQISRCRALGPCWTGCALSGRVLRSRQKQRTSSTTTPCRCGRQNAMCFPVCRIFR